MDTKPLISRLSWALPDKSLPGPPPEAADTEVSRWKSRGWKRLEWLGNRGVDHDGDLFLEFDVRGIFHVVGVLGELKRIGGFLSTSISGTRGEYTSFGKPRVFSTVVTEVLPKFGNPITGTIHG